jgi:hypothetical protein
MRRTLRGADGGSMAQFSREWWCYLAIQPFMSMAARHSAVDSQFSFHESRKAHVETLTATGRRLTSDLPTCGRGGS